MGNEQCLPQATPEQQQVVITRLLQFPWVFVYAFRHREDIGLPGYRLQSFINAKLAELRQRQAASPRSPDLNYNDQTLYLYMIDYLIRTEASNRVEQIRFLLTIPALRDIAHCEPHDWSREDFALQMQPTNYFFHLAESGNDATVKAILLEIPAVRALADYRESGHEQKINRVGAPDLTQRLAESKESSMMALTPGEQKRLRKVIAHYQGLVNWHGIDKCVADLRNKLEQLYLDKNNPNAAAKIIIKGKAQSLPLEWKDFQDKTLSKKEREKALKAYYQHPVHTAWRYLLKPNPWLAENAPYAYKDPKNPRQQWSNFEKFGFLIAIFFLAATDEAIPATDDYTVADRFQQFIKELAFINRAHNWDRSRLIPETRNQVPALEYQYEQKEERTEEYDDLEADNPSCQPGVTRRLFQSVQGHPLISKLTKAVIAIELNKFVRKHFEEIFRDAQAAATITNAWGKVVELEDKANENLKVLRKYDLSVEKQNTFFALMWEEYSDDFDNSFCIEINRDLCTLSPGSLDDYSSHFSKFFERAGLKRLLQKPQPPTERSKSPLLSVSLLSPRVTPLQPHESKEVQAETRQTQSLSRH